MTEAKYNLPPDVIRGICVNAYVRLEEDVLGQAQLGEGRPQLAQVVNETIGDLDKYFSEFTEPKYINFIPPSDTVTRLSIQEAGLNASKGFWETKLKEPGLSSAVTALGNNRLETINQRLEEFNKPPGLHK